MILIFIKRILHYARGAYSSFRKDKLSWTRNKKDNMLKKRRMKITQLERVRFIKVNELKLTHAELF